MEEKINYRSITDPEHVRKTPGTYIGDVYIKDKEQWVVESDGCFNYRKIKYIPGLAKLYDEIICNAYDEIFHGANYIDIALEEDLSISVINNGRCIEITKRPGDDKYIPEVIFSVFRTSAHYADDDADDDTKPKKVDLCSGTHGLGAKIVNCLSEYFVVNTVDPKTRYLFTQSWHAGERDGEPTIEHTTDKPYTNVSFKPDEQFFRKKMIVTDAEWSQALKDTLAFVRRRVYDISAFASGKMKVILNGQEIPIKDPFGYMSFLTQEFTRIKGYDNNYYSVHNISPQVAPGTYNYWQVICIYSESIDVALFPAMNFVNSIYCPQGSHIRHVEDQVKKYCKAQGLIDKTNAKTFNNMFTVAVFAQLHTRGFSSQTKEELTTPPRCYSPVAYTLPEKTFKAIIEDGLKEAFVSFMSRNKRPSNRRPIIKKLMDANLATGKGNYNTLIIVEGDSAMNLVLNNRPNADNYGIYAIRGKTKNVFKKKHTDLDDEEKNNIISNIIKAMGLRRSVVYTDRSMLRYQQIMIMADADIDGQHIKGLLISLFECFWPSLLERFNDFIVSLETPILKIMPKTKASKEAFVRECITKPRTFLNDIESKSFISEKEYLDFLQHLEVTYNVTTNDIDVYYYKGLATSDNVEGKQYFSNMNLLTCNYFADETSKSKIRMAFGKDVKERKEWLTAADSDPYVFKKEMSYSEFIDTRLKEFSKASLKRGIPSLVDGLKPSSRKVIYTALTRKDADTKMKLNNFCGLVTEKTSYHHGEVSLQKTTCRLAQNFTGTNNINLLTPVGQFGSKISPKPGGARYIYTHISPEAKVLFDKRDLPLLKYLDDDGKQIEPEFFVPVLPVVLINGAKGLATGWSTEIPPYNPQEIATWIEQRHTGTPTIVLNPYYRGFGGKTFIEKSGRYAFLGRIGMQAGGWYQIIELPPHMTYIEYKEEVLDKMLREEIIKDIIVNKGTGDTMSYSVSPGKKFPAEVPNLFHFFKLVEYVNTTNMYLFDSNGCLKKYETVYEILEEFYQVRTKYYSLRKQYILEDLDCTYRSNCMKYEFIMGIINKIIPVNNTEREVAFKKAKEYLINFDPSDEEIKHLFKKAILSLTLEEVERLKKKNEEISKEIERITETTEVQMWQSDLAELQF